MKRLEYLDGLRGVAIALVVLFHAYARWPQIALGPSWLAQGKMGVQLFFLISGFVIFMSLERSKGLGDFLRRRWLRLFPAMLAVSLFIYATANLFERPIGTASLRDLLPGLTFIEPEWWAVFLGSPQGVLEGSFWSLFVEVKFYVVVSLVFYFVGEWAAIATLVGMFFAPMVVGHFITGDAVYTMANALSSWHWGWFAAGALHYKFATTRRGWLFVAALALSLVAAAKVEADCVPAAVCMALLFAAAQISQPLRTMLSVRAATFLGVVSYPLYLLHENMMVGMSTALHGAAPWLPRMFVPVLPIILVVLLAWLFTRWVEPAVKKALIALAAPRPTIAAEAAPPA